ncbi:hypothetical protein ACTXT7_009130 [Hymenolepis weldensis]
MLSGIEYQEAHCKSIIQQILQGLEHIHRIKQPIFLLQLLEFEDHVWTSNPFDYRKKRAPKFKIEVVNRFHGIMHRDLKLENVLIGRDGFVKIADFGLSRLKNQNDSYSPHIGTKRYRPPEIMLELGKYNEGFDIFNAGIILSEMYLRDHLFGPPILRKRLKDSSASVDAIDLAVKLLSINPANRPKAHEALKDQYFVNSPQPDGNILQFLPKTLKIS